MSRNILRAGTVMMQFAQENARELRRPKKTRGEGRVRPKDRLKTGEDKILRTDAHRRNKLKLDSK